MYKKTYNVLITHQMKAMIAKLISQTRKPTEQVKLKKKKNSKIYRFIIKYINGRSLWNKLDRNHNVDVGNFLGAKVWEIKQNIALANTLTTKPYTLEQPTSIPIKIQGLLGN